MNNLTSEITLNQIDSDRQSSQMILDITKIQKNALILIMITLFKVGDINRKTAH